MELVKVSEKGTLSFKMSDGRIGTSYDSGYIRISSGQSYSEDHYKIYGRPRLHQLNKKIKVYYDEGEYSFNYVRVLIPNQIDRLKALIKYNNKNCK